MQAILNEYDGVREQNRRILAKRHEEISVALPEYSMLSRQIAQLSVRHASGDTSFDYKKELSLLKEQKQSILTSHGYSLDHLEPIFTCTKCKDTGFVNNKRCTCLQKKITDLLYNQSGICSMIEKNNFKHLSYDYYEGESLALFQKALEASKAMISNFPKEKSNILFYGTVGCGKSFLSGCIAKELIDKAYSVVYFSSIAFFDILHKNTLYNGVNELYNYDLVIIDDLGSEMTNSFVTSALFSFLTERSLKGQATIISTNLNLAEIKDRYSDRIASRMIQNFKLCKLSGPDIRIQMQLDKRK